MNETSRSKAPPSHLKTHVRAGDNPGMGPYDVTDGWTCRKMPPRTFDDGSIAIDLICERKTT